MEGREFSAWWDWLGRRGPGLPDALAAILRELGFAAVEVIASRFVGRRLGYAEFEARRNGRRVAGLALFACGARRREGDAALLACRLLEVAYDEA